MANNVLFIAFTSTIWSGTLTFKARVAIYQHACYTFSHVIKPCTLERFDQLLNSSSTGYKKQANLVQTRRGLAR